MTLLLLYLFMALFISFLCSLLESVILSVSPAYIATSIKNKKGFAPHLKQLHEDIDRPLAAILTLNTLANTIGAAGVGAQVQNIYGDTVAAIFSAALAFAILVFSEVIPKTLGASRWKEFAPFCTYTTRVLISIMYPFVTMSEFIARILKAEKDTQVTREEMIVTAEMGASDGTLRKKESLIIKNLLMLNNMYVHDIMTPRSVLLAFNEELSVGEVIKNNQPIRYSRIPVFRHDLDQIQGVVHRYKILEASSNDQHDLKLKNLTKPVHSVPEDITVSACLDQLIQRQEHLFVVVDDYGSTMGIVTLEDSIETLLGVEIVDEFDSVADLRQYALEQWKNRKKSKTLLTPVKS